MVESLMLIALGFMAATFIGILLSQFIWRRAVTVTTRRLQENSDQQESPDLTEMNAALEAAEARAEGNAATLQATSLELDTAKAELATSKETIVSLQTTAQEETAQNSGLSQEIEKEKEKGERLTKELSQSETKFETAKDALTTAEAKILKLSSDTTIQTKEISDLNQALTQSKLETETAQTGRVKAEGILTNVSTAAAALVATLPSAPEQPLTEKLEEPEKSEAPQAAEEAETTEKSEVPETEEAPSEAIAPPEQAETPEINTTSEEATSPETTQAETTSEESSSPAELEVASEPALDAEKELPALVAAIPTLDEFEAQEASTEEQPVKHEEAELSSNEDVAGLATASTLDARIEALKEGVSSPA